MTTTDPNDPALNKINPNGQKGAYLVLSPEDLKKSYVRPVRRHYTHRGNPVEGEIEVINFDALSPEDVARYKKWGYYAFMKYPEAKSPLVGRYLTKDEYEGIKDGFYGGCGTVTTMATDIAQTWARNPKFYGATFCAGCGIHLPVSEFVWHGTDEVLGSEKVSLGGGLSDLLKTSEEERLRMQLAACGVAAMSNTRESAKKQRISKDSLYYSASYEDVCSAVDREMQLREELEEIKAALSILLKYTSRP